MADLDVESIGQNVQEQLISSVDRYVESSTLHVLKPLITQLAQSLISSSSSDLLSSPLSVSVIATSVSSPSSDSS